MTPHGSMILAVEDDARNAALLRAVLEPAGFRMLFADSLASARAELAQATPDLVLLDVGLPDGNGLDLARELRASARTATVPIITASARVLPADQTAAQDAGSDRFLPKPLRPRELLSAVHALLGADEPT